MDIAKHVRIFDKLPSDELVEKRRDAVGAIAKRYKELKTVNQLLHLAADLTAAVVKGGALPEARIVEVEECIKEKSTSFIREGQELQLLTCALLGALKLLEEAQPTAEGTWSRTDVIGLGFWSGLGFQPSRTEERLEALRMELLDASRKLVIASSANARTRKVVPAIAVSTPVEYQAAEVATSIQSGAAKTIDALRLNAALDREEIDLLWWVLADWSKLTEMQFSRMDKIAAIVIAGLEAGTLLRRIPGEAHKHLVLRFVTEDIAVSIETMIEALAGHRSRLRSFFETSHFLHGNESVFPLIATCLFEPRIPKGIGARSFTLSDWGSRALLESAILHVGTLPQDLI